MKQFPVAVIIEKQQIDNRWVSEKWEAIGVVPAFGAEPDSPPKQIFADEQREQFAWATFLVRDRSVNAFALPGGHDKVLLHSCCAPCSGEVMEAMLASGIDYSIYFCQTLFSITSLFISMLMELFHRSQH